MDARRTINHVFINSKKELRPNKIIKGLTNCGGATTQRDKKNFVFALHISI
jgi:hypothetical protein